MRFPAGKLLILNFPDSGIFRPPTKESFEFWDLKIVTDAKDKGRLFEVSMTLPITFPVRDEGVWATEIFTEIKNIKNRFLSMMVCFEVK